MNTRLQAFKLIDQPYKFCQGGYALDKKHNAVEPTSSKAVAFDMLGALTRVHGYTPIYEGVECVNYPPIELEKDIEYLTKLAHKAFPHCKQYSLGPINDILSYEDVLELYTLLAYMDP